MRHAYDNCLTRFISPYDPRARSAEMKEALCHGVEELMNRGCLRVFKTLQQPRDVKYLSCRNALASKRDEAEAQRYESRPLLDGHLTSAFLLFLKRFYQNLSRQPLHILDSSKMNNFNLWCENAPESFSWSKKLLAQLTMAENMPPDFWFSDAKRLQVVNHLYGLSDSGDHWHTTIYLSLHHKDL